MSTHPLHKQLVNYVDELCSTLPDGVSSIAIIPPYCLQSDRYTHARHPSSLPRLLSSWIPPPALTATDDNLEPPSSTDDSQKAAGSGDPAGGTFLGMPAVHLDMGVKKWRWPGYLTIGRGGKGKGSHESSDREQKSHDGSPQGEEPAPTEHHDEPDPAETHEEGEASRTVPVEVNQSALEDAMAEAPADIDDDAPTEATSDITASDLPSKISSTKEDDMATPTPSKIFAHTSSQSTTSSLLSEKTILPPELRSRTVHLASQDTPSLTTPRTVHYIEVITQTDLPCLPELTTVPARGYSCGTGGFEGRVRTR